MRFGTFKRHDFFQSFASIGRVDLVFVFGGGQSILLISEFSEFRNLVASSISHLDLLELLGGYEGWQGPVSVLLTPEVDKVGADGEVLAGAQLGQAQLRGQVVVGHLVPHSPPHVHNLHTTHCFGLLSYSFFTSF